MSNNEFKDIVFDLYKGEYELLNDYINDKTEVKLKHVKCKTEFNILPRKIINRNITCPFCRVGKRSNINIYKKRVSNLVGDEYSVLGEYYNCHTKIKMKHNKCGNEYFVTPNHFIQGSRCPYCDKTRKSNINKFKQKVKELTNDEYTVLSDTYVNNKTKIKIKHNECGNEYFVTPKNFIRKDGNRCPFCNRLNKQSKAIRLIKKYFDKYDIEYIEEKRFDSCRDVYTLPFDFYLPDYDLLIEYDGKQHYAIDNTSFFNEEYYNKCHKHDEMKNKWCKENNKDLLRINYKQNPILILDNYLNENYEIVE